MIATVVKDFFCRSSPKGLVYGDYKNFDREFSKENYKKNLIVKLLHGITLNKYFLEY